MRQLRTFWYSFKKSLSSPSYYRDIVKVPSSFSFKYIIILIYFSILVSSLIFAVQAALMLPKLPLTMNTVEKRLQELYPDDFIIQVKNGIISINKPEPFYIDIPELKETREFSHLITFDSKASVEDYTDYQSVVLVTDREIIYPDSDKEGISGYRVAEINRDENITITRKDYDSLLSKFSVFFKWIPYLAPWLLLIGVLVIPVIGTLFSLLWNLVVIAIFSLIAWGISGLFKNGLGYKKIYQMGLHAVTFPMVLSFFLELMGIVLPLVFTASYLFWMVFILARYKEVKV